MTYSWSEYWRILLSRLNASGQTNLFLLHFSLSCHLVFVLKTLFQSRALFGKEQEQECGYLLSYDWSGVLRRGLAKNHFTSNNTDPWEVEQNRVQNWRNETLYSDRLTAFLCLAYRLNYALMQPPSFSLFFYQNVLFNLPSLNLQSNNLRCF